MTRTALLLLLALVSSAIGAQAYPSKLTLEQFAAFLTQDAERWSKAVKLSGATLGLLKS